MFTNIKYDALVKGNVPYIILLSGTPVPNALSDIVPLPCDANVHRVVGKGIHEAKQDCEERITETRRETPLLCQREVHCENKSETRPSWAWQRDPRDCQRRERRCQRHREITRSETAAAGSEVLTSGQAFVVRIQRGNNNPPGIYVNNVIQHIFCLRSSSRVAGGRRYRERQFVANPRRCLLTEEKGQLKTRLIGLFELRKQREQRKTLRAAC